MPPSKLLGASVDGEWLVLSIPDKMAKSRIETKEGHRRENAWMKVDGKTQHSASNVAESGAPAMPSTGAEACGARSKKTRWGDRPTYTYAEEENDWLLVTATQKSTALTSPSADSEAAGVCTVSRSCDATSIDADIILLDAGAIHSDEPLACADTLKLLDTKARCWTKAQGDPKVQRWVTGWIRRVSIESQRPTNIAEQEDADDFVCVAETPATVGRALLRQRSVMMRTALWVWLGLLVLGESSTTIYWCLSLSRWDLLASFVPLVIFLIALRAVMRQDQVCALVLGVALAVAPALPAYSAAHLILSSQSHVASSVLTWMLYAMRLTVLGVLHLAGSLLPVLHAEHPEPGVCMSAVMRGLYGLQALADAAFTVGLWTYVGVAVYFLLAWILRLDVARSRDAFIDSREIALTFHTLGILCQRGVVCTYQALGEEFLPCLLGTQRARSCTPQAITWRYVGVVTRLTPQLRRCVPPRIAVAFVISLRQLAPILFPGLAVLPYSVNTGPGGLNFAVPLAFALGLALTVLAEHHHRALPTSALQQVPMLLPSGVPQRLRRMLGHMLVAADTVEGTRTSVIHYTTSLALFRTFAAKLNHWRKSKLS